MYWRKRDGSMGKAAPYHAWDHFWGLTWWKKRSDPKAVQFCGASLTCVTEKYTWHCVCQFSPVTGWVVRNSGDLLFMSGRSSFLIGDASYCNYLRLDLELAVSPQAKEGWDSGREVMRMRIRSRKICFLPFWNFSSWSSQWELVTYLSLPHFWIRCQGISFHGKLGKSGRKLSIS